jgi:hypothetical protein
MAHGAVIDSADTKIHFRSNDDGTFRAEPLLHALRLGEAPPHQIARRIEHARDYEVGGFRLGKHVILRCERFVLCT